MGTIAMRPKGLEPPAHCLEGSCSIHLSYGRMSYPYGVCWQGQPFDAGCERYNSIPGGFCQAKNGIFFHLFGLRAKTGMAAPFWPKTKSPRNAPGTAYCQKSPSRTTCAYGWDTDREICRRECARLQLPAAETGEAEQGPRSVFCKGATTPAAKAGNRNQRNFCRAYARRNGFPLKRVVLRHAHYSSSMASTICWAMYLWPWMVGWPSLAVLVRGMGT